MEEDTNELMGLCADLVTLKRMEAFPLRLLRDQKPGEWVPVNRVCHTSGIDTTGAVSELVVTWLPDPFGDQEYAVIIFYDGETVQSFAARYNRRRLLDNA